MHRSNLTNTPNADDNVQVQLSNLSGDVHAVIKMVGDLALKVDKLTPGHVEKEWFSSEEAAEQLGLKEWTVRAYCRRRRILGEKRPDRNWKISAAEIKRYKEHGPSQECKLDIY
jgi:hypothetical protein